jgi:predicted transcriptional regulator YheO
MAQEKEKKESLARARGGWETGGLKKKEALVSYTDIERLYSKLLQSGDSKKAARLSVSTRLGVSEQTIYRALRLVKLDE